MKGSIKKIIEILSDYREGEIDRIDKVHVKRWLNQFEEEEREAIAVEVANLLEEYYVPKQEVREFMEGILEHEGIIPNGNIKEINFLDIQRKGNSQTEMLELIDDILIEEYNLKVSECGGGNVYLYIDDGIFTGYTLLHDIKNWIKKGNAPTDAVINIVTIVMHEANIKYIRRELDALKKDNKIGDYSLWRVAELKNYKTQYTKKIDVMWVENRKYDRISQTYIDNLSETIEENRRAGLFRTQVVEDNFTTKENRLIVEGAFLRKGVELINNAKEPSASMKPLGYEKFNTLGFGTFFCTYRNIANNCPLVLWYGDPDKYGEDSPLGKWYPLMPRKVNSIF